MLPSLTAGEPQECRRRRVIHAPWSFNVGDAVRSGDLTAIVLSRRRTAMGRELYHVWVMGNSYGRPYRWFLGAYVSGETTRPMMMQA